MSRGILEQIRNLGRLEKIAIVEGVGILIGLGDVCLRVFQCQYKSFIEMAKDPWAAVGWVTAISSLFALITSGYRYDHKLDKYTHERYTHEGQTNYPIAPIEMFKNETTI